MDRPTSIAFSYTRAADYQVAPANGVIGTITPLGDLKLDFYVEAAPVDNEVRPLIDGNQIGEAPAKTTSEIRVGRELQVGILIAREQAKALADLIYKQLGVFDALKEKASDVL